MNEFRSTSFGTILLLLLVITPKEATQDDGSLSQCAASIAVVDVSDVL
jgi:hypothetical protein